MRSDAHARVPVSAPASRSPRPEILPSSDPIHRMSETATETASATARRDVYGNVACDSHRAAAVSLRARFGAYLLTDVIGQGGMAVVYRAKREGWSGFEKTVVVKAMLPSLAAHREHVDRFIAEAKISAQLSHPGIVQVHDFGVFQGTPYLVMEHLNGVNLSQLLNELAQEGRRVPVNVALVIATQMCHALGYAHAFRDGGGARRQVIHSDVSPSNVMVCRDGSVKLLDFGVAKVIDAYDYDTSITVRGKYPYMAPEQINGLPVDRRVDVFAAGIVLHELLTGRRLFAAPTELETLRRVDACEVPPPSLFNHEVSLGLDAVALRALARDPADRFDSGDEMAAALEQIEHAGGGRKRVAEFLAEIFPHNFAVICQVCGKQAVPGFACAECGNRIDEEAASTENVRLQDVLADEDLEPEIQVHGDPTEPFQTFAKADPYPLATVVERRHRSYTRVAALVGSVGLVAGVAILRMRLPQRLGGHAAIARPTPRRDESGPICVQPPGEPDFLVQQHNNNVQSHNDNAQSHQEMSSAPPAAMLTATTMPMGDEPRVVVQLHNNNVQTHNENAQAHHKMRARHDRQPPPLDKPAPAPARAHKAVRDGALLDPFGE
jgi:tRNA A-37 threonylcarbamoyl transferase component Bud32